MNPLDIVPLFRFPFVDLAPSLLNNQQFGACGKIEMKAMSCLEAYGLHKGKIECADLISDYHECLFNTTQLKRVKFMKLKMMKDYYTGKRDTRYAEDPKTTSI